MLLRFVGGAVCVGCAKMGTEKIDTDRSFSSLMAGNRRRIVLCLAIALLTSCSTEDAQKLSRNQPPRQLPREQAALDDFLRTRDETNFSRLCQIGEKSAQAKFRAISSYAILSELMTPNGPSPSDEEIGSAENCLRENAGEIATFLLPVLRLHDNPWRRWTAAKIVGNYGNSTSISTLKECLKNESDQIVKDYIETAIEEINSRMVSTKKTKD